ncbi:hypothetical protein [Flaviaesturariibacter amylovorans]|uniref:Tryptophan-rich sensory protein n=1 Tax=Flaviaesturariibacter amylovorans TaxID=1084520 RepID=A0ABP8GFK2_9BACT
MKSKRWLVLAVTLASLFGQYWINAGMTPLKPTAEVAGREVLLNYTLPPPFIFSIWGLIYLGFVYYAFYGVSRTAIDDRQADRAALPAALSIFLNLLWTVIVGAEWWVPAYFLQWAMLAVAIVLLRRWAPERWLSIPFALYAGWLTVAMIPFTTDLLNRSGWSGAPLPARTWAVLIYVVACAIVLLAFRRLRQPFYLLPLAWALFGLAIRFDGVLRLTAGVLSAMLLLLFLYQGYRWQAATQVRPDAALLHEKAG